MKICVDIGGTKVAASVATGEQELSFRQSEPTVKTGDANALSQQVLRLIDAACQAAGGKPEDISRVGIASAGPFVKRDGLIELASPNISGGLAAAHGANRLPNEWMSIPFEAPLKKRFEHLRIENDGVAALEAERRWGALQGVDSCAYVTWSTGVGVGLCVDGKILRGKNGNAGHAGHTFVSDNLHAVCGCGNVGDVESLIGGASIEELYGVESKTLFERAMSGDAKSMAYADASVRVMARLLYNLIATMDLQKISIGGSLFFHQKEWLLPRLNEQVYAFFPALTKGVELVPAGLGNKVGDYAALALVD